MFLISIMFCIPYWLKFKYTPDLGLHETELGKNPLFNRIVHFWMYLPIAYFIPLTILIITNVYLIGTIMVARRRRQRLGMTTSTSTSTSNKTVHHQAQTTREPASPQSIINNNTNNNPINNSQQQQQPLIVTCKNRIEEKTTALRRPSSRGQSRGGGMSITIMLIAVVFLFFCCQCPVLILHIMTSMFCTENDADRYRCKTSSFYLYGQVIAKFLLICNLSLNFACYCLFSSQFRIVMRETLLPTRYKLTCVRLPLCFKSTNSQDNHNNNNNNHVPTVV